VCSFARSALKLIRFVADIDNGARSDCRSWPHEASTGYAMSTLFLLSLCGVAVVIIAAVVEAALAAAQKPSWRMP
jgi:hypothetical protein